MIRSLVMGALGIGALAGGMTLGAGCLPCDCPTPVPFEGGDFEIAQSSDERIVGGTIQTMDDEVVVTYTDAEGRVWQATWAMVEGFDES